MCTEMSPTPVFLSLFYSGIFSPPVFITGCMITASDQKLEAETAGNDAIVLPR